VLFSQRVVDHRAELMRVASKDKLTIWAEQCRDWRHSFGLEGLPSFVN
jgi:hypothetical protein